MSRDGSGVYSKPGGTTAVSGAAISSSAYNTFCDDLVTDLNAARPITAGGTGATSASGARTALGVSATDATITAIAALDFSAAGSMLYSTAADTFSLITTTVAGRALLDDADASAQRTTLGLGTAAVKATGTSGNTVPLLDGAATTTGLWTFTAQRTKFQAASEVYSIALAYGSGTGVAYLGASNSATPDIQISNAAGSSIATFSNDRSTTLSGIVYATGGSFSGAGVPVVINSTNNALVASIGFNGVVGGYIGTNGSTGLALTEVSATVYLTLTSTAATITGGGLVVGAPTGGNKGAGTINATAVYDDNTLLTCYVLDAAIDGTVDMAKWDEKVPNRIIPATMAVVEDTEAEPDAEGVYPTKLVEVEPEAIEERIHADARKFVARLGTDSDPLNIDKYADHWKTKRHLTSMPNEATFDPVAGMPMGAWVQRLIETVEIQAVHIDNLNQRLKALEGA